MSLDEVKKLITQPIVVFDTETTGFEPAYGAEVVELAAEKIIDGKIVDTYHALFCPTRPMGEEVIAIHGLTNEYLASHGVPYAARFPDFAAFSEGTVLSGHNIRRFDMPFLQMHAMELGMPPFRHELLDTLELSRSLLRLPNHKLATVASHFKISTSGHHRAEADVAMTRQVLFALLKQLP